MNIFVEGGMRSGSYRLQEIDYFSPHSLTTAVGVRYDKVAYQWRLTVRRCAPSYYRRPITFGENRNPLRRKAGRNSVQTKTLGKLRGRRHVATRRTAPTANKTRATARERHRVIGRASSLAPLGVNGRADSNGVHQCAIWTCGTTPAALGSW